MPYRTLHRYCVERCGPGRTAATVRVADGEPGAECQLDFGYLGLLADPVTGRQRKVHALIFTACYSRHMFVWLSFSQTLAAVIAGCEAAWAFFGGVFKVLIPDNASAIVADADAVNPRFTAGWLDYAQARRVRHRRRPGPVAEGQTSGCILHLFGTVRAELAFGLVMACLGGGRFSGGPAGWRGRAGRRGILPCRYTGCR